MVKISFSPLQHQIKTSPTEHGSHELHPPEATEWALAEFALGDLHHHTIRLEQMAIALRASSSYDAVHDEPRIQADIARLWQMHQGWKSRNIIRQAALDEKRHRIRFPIPPCVEQFLHYAPLLYFKNGFFVRMLLYHTERVIQIDLIHTPSLRKPSERRVRAAVEVCRIVAGVKDMSEGIGQYFQGLSYAGLAFDPLRYPDGFIYGGRD